MCEWFYLQDCGQGPGQDISWWDDFAAVVPCPECTGYQEYQDMLRDRLYAHWEEHYYALGSAIDFWDFYNRNLEWNCDPYSPCFEECVDENFVNDYFNLPPIPITPISFPQALDDCFISITACPNCFYTATLYIEQPVPGTREIFDWTGNGSSGSGKNSGHTFMSLKQYDPAVSLIEPIRTLTFGFYPAYKPEGQNTVPGSFYEENEATVFNVSVLYSLTLSQYEDIKTSLSNIENIYQIEYSNCSTLPAIVLNHAGFNIPMTERHVWRLGDIKANPADLGEDLRANHAPGTIITSDTYLNPPLSKCN